MSLCPGCGVEKPVHHLVSEDVPRFCMECLRVPMARLRARIESTHMVVFAAHSANILEPKKQTEKTRNGKAAHLLKLRPHGRKDLSGKHMQALPSTQLLAGVDSTDQQVPDIGAKRGSNLRRRMRRNHRLSSQR